MRNTIIICVFFFFFEETYTCNMMDQFTMIESLNYNAIITNIVLGTFKNLFDHLNKNKVSLNFVI